MLEKAVSGAPGLAVESIEVDRRGTSYTVDTLKELKRRFKCAKFFLILGGDNYVQFKSWKSVKEIRRLATLAVYDRNTVAGGKRNRGIGSAISLRGPYLEISSTMVRHKVRNGESIRFLVPRSVEQYIRRHNLYTR
jgi:nicotinate-nucleotide adenylyltransferase